MRLRDRHGDLFSLALCQLILLPQLGNYIVIVFFDIDLALLQTGELLSGVLPLGRLAAFDSADIGAALFELLTLLIQRVDLLPQRLLC